MKKLVAKKIIADSLPEETFAFELRGGAGYVMVIRSENIKQEEVKRILDVMKVKYPSINLSVMAVTPGDDVEFYEVE